MITAQQMRAARALAGIDQKTLAERAGVSLPTIQRMEASEGVVRGVVDTLVKVIRALDESGVELIGANQASAAGGRGVRLKARAGRRPIRLRLRTRTAAPAKIAGAPTLMPVATATADKYADDPAARPCGRPS